MTAFEAWPDQCAETGTTVALSLPNSQVAYPPALLCPTSSGPKRLRVAEGASQGPQGGQKAPSGSGVKESPEGLSEGKQHSHRSDQHQAGRAVTGPQNAKPLLVSCALALRAGGCGRGFRLLAHRRGRAVGAVRRPARATIALRRRARVSIYPVHTGAGATVGLVRPRARTNAWSGARRRVWPIARLVRPPIRRSSADAGLTRPGTSPGCLGRPVPAQALGPGLQVSGPGLRGDDYPCSSKMGPP